MPSKRILLSVALAALLLGLAALHAQTAREQALAAIDSSDPDVRLQAVAQLAVSGQMADAQVLLDALYDDDAGVRAAAEQGVWQVWMRSGDPDVDALLQSGIRHMEQRQMGQAVDAFTRVIEKRPDFAEGWNKRATAYYLMGDVDQSLKDCDEVIKRNPHHFGALSGYGLLYVQRGELERAREYFERALEVNPNMEGVEQTVTMIRYKLGKSGKQSI